MGKLRFRMEKEFQVRGHRQLVEESLMRMVVRRWMGTEWRLIIEQW